jgi:hypothetical protein
MCYQHEHYVLHELEILYLNRYCSRLVTSTVEG